MTNLVNRRPAGFNYTFRPTSYFEGLDPRTLLLSSISGEHRRRDVEERLRSGDFDPAVWGEWLTEPTLDPDTRSLLASVHPALMSGEYLPSIGEEEIEIVRIVLASTTGDVTSIRARRNGKQIFYSVVDEYESIFHLKRKTSTQPLTMEELVDLINLTEREGDEFPDGVTYPGGLGIGHVVWQVEEGYADDIDELRRFVTVESSFYPELKQFYAIVINDYLDAVEEARREQEEEEA